MKAQLLTVVALVIAFFAAPVAAFAQDTPTTPVVPEVDCTKEENHFKKVCQEKVPATQQDIYELMTLFKGDLKLVNSQLEVLGKQADPDVIQKVVTDWLDSRSRINNQLLLSISPTSTFKKDSALTLMKADLTYTRWFNAAEGWLGLQVGVDAGSAQYFGHSMPTFGADTAAVFRGLISQDHQVYGLAGMGVRGIQLPEESNPAGGSTMVFPQVNLGLGYTWTWLDIGVNFGIPLGADKNYAPGALSPQFGLSLGVDVLKVGK